MSVRRLNIEFPELGDVDISVEDFKSILNGFDGSLFSHFTALEPWEQQKIVSIISELQSNGESLSLREIWQEDFIRVPPTPEEFMTDDYFVGRRARDLFPKWREELLYVLDPRNSIREWIITGAIGSGKSFAATFAQAYKLCIIACMRNPQKYYGLAEDTSLVFSVFNLTIEKTELTLYRDLKNLLNSSPFFRETFPLKTVYGSRGEEKEVEMPKGVILIAGSRATHALSTNVFSCILDEMNFRDSKKAVSYTDQSEAFNLYTQIHRRITSRFITTPGILVLISSRQTITDFLEEHIDKSKDLPHVHVSDYPLWETKPKSKFTIYYKTGKTFDMLIGDRANNRNSKVLKEDDVITEEMTVRRGIPIDLLEDALLDPNGFARDVVGAATYPSEPLIPDRQRIVDCIDTNRKHPFHSETMVLNFRTDTKIQDNMREEMLVWDTGDLGLRPISHPDKPRVIACDLSLTGDCTGIAMGFPLTVKVVRTVVKNMKTGGMERKMAPRWFIYFDFFLEIEPPQHGAGEIDLEKIQDFIVYLRESLHFKIWKVSCDGYQSRHMRQNLIKRGFDAVLLSVDKDDIPYVDLRQAVLEQRAAFYDYPPFMEIEFLQHIKNIRGKLKGKVDHLKGKRKDVCDAAAAVAHWCTQYPYSEVLKPTPDIIEHMRGKHGDIRDDKFEDILYKDYIKTTSKGRKERKIIGIN